MSDASESIPVVLNGAGSPDQPEQVQALQESAEPAEPVASEAAPRRRARQRKAAATEEAPQAKRPGRPRKAAPKAETAEAPKVVALPSPPAEPLTPAALIEGEELELHVSGQSEAGGSQFWGEKPEDTIYEVELEVRSQAEQSQGQAAAIGDLAAGVLKLVGENLRRMTEQQGARVREMLSGVDLKDYLDPAFWEGIGMVLKYQLDEQIAFVQRRLRGEYSTDPYGMDREAIEMVRPFVTFMYRTWWRVETEGLEHVPGSGRALLVSNHSGVLPWDGAMIAAAVAEDHPEQKDRVVRNLYLHWFSSLPLVAPTLAAMGQVPGIPENAVRLLENDELVCVFPEGLKGVGKLFKDRYKLARFGRGGFVQAALRARAPIVPVAVVGAEEIYPMLANVEPIAKLLGFPYFPLTPFFPWLGPLGVIPLPTRWHITFCPPIPTDEYGPDAAADPLTVLALAEQVRETIQTTIDARLAERKSIF